jgi:outer membrane protein OmpA-like peptidoglycan-associated protein
MNLGIHAALAAGTLLIPSALVYTWVDGAQARLEAFEASEEPHPSAQIASMAEEGYCSIELKKVLRRVLQSCGLAGEGRGCQPKEAKSVAMVAGQDFNALFLPLKDRAGILQFDQDSDSLDQADLALLDAIYSNQRGGSYFFVVSRSSPEGSVSYNSELSQRRGTAVLTHLQQTFDDKDMSKKVGLLWLGEEVGQLDQEFCTWTRSGPAEACQPADLNRSAFIAWIDCRL